MAQIKPTMNIVFVGHVDHGKSTCVGRLMYDSGILPEQEMKKLKKPRESFEGFKALMKGKDRPTQPKDFSQPQNIPSVIMPNEPILYSWQDANVKNIGVIPAESSHHINERYKGRGTGHQGTGMYSVSNKDKAMYNAGYGNAKRILVKAAPIKPFMATAEKDPDGDWGNKRSTDKFQQLFYVASVMNNASLNDLVRAKKLMPSEFFGKKDRYGRRF